MNKQIHDEGYPPLCNLKIKEEHSLQFEKHNSAFTLTLDDNKISNKQKQTNIVTKWCI